MCILYILLCFLILTLRGSFNVAAENLPSQERIILTTITLFLGASCEKLRVCINIYIHIHKQICVNINIQSYVYNPPTPKKNELYHLYLCISSMYSFFNIFVFYKTYIYTQHPSTFRNKTQMVPFFPLRWLTPPPNKPPCRRHLGAGLGPGLMTTTNGSGEGPIAIGSFPGGANKKRYILGVSPAH